MAAVDVTAVEVDPVEAAAVEVIAVEVVAVEVIAVEVAAVEATAAAQGSGCYKKVTINQQQSMQEGWTTALRGNGGSMSNCCCYTGAVVYSQ